MDEKNLHDFCSSHQFDLIKILNSNKRKDTATILVRKKSSDSDFVVKIHGESIPEKIKKQFQNEIEFYTKNPSEYLPKMVMSGQNYFVLNFIKGKTLRDFIYSNFNEGMDDKIDEIYLLSESTAILDWFYSLGEGRFASTTDDKKLILDTLMGRIGNLISSGPKETSRSRLEDFILKEILKIFLPKIKQKLAKRIDFWQNSNLKILSNYGNTDLHTNNFLVETEGLKLIDYENVISPGVWVADVLYFYATFYSCFSSKIIREKIRRHAYSYFSQREPNFNGDDINNLLNVFLSAAEANSRFRLRDKGLKINKIISFLLSVIRFN